MKVIDIWYTAFQIRKLSKKPEAVEIALKDATLLDKSRVYQFLTPFFGEGLVTSSTNKWKIRRKLLNPCLHFDILKDFVPIFNEQARKLVRNLQNGTDDEVRDLFQAISYCVVDITCETILGVKVGAQDNENKKFVHALESMGSIAMERMVTWWMWPEIFYRLTETYKNQKRILQIANEFTNNVLSQKKREYTSQGKDASPERKKKKALMDLLLELHMEKHSLSEEDIIEEVHSFTAADDTTSITIYFTLYFLGQHKEIQDKVHQELDAIFGNDKEKSVEMEDLKHLSYMECVIKETLRLHPPVPIFGRNTQEEKIICGYPIPKGATVFIPPYSLHRNPSVFQNPEKFDPARFLPENSIQRHPYAYIPFSAGLRNCIGQTFAMIGMKIILSTLLRHFSVESMPTRDKLVPSAEISLRTSVPPSFRLKKR